MTRRRLRRTPALVTLAALVVVVVAGLAQWHGDPAPAPAGGGGRPGTGLGAEPGAPGSARLALQGLEVRTEERVPGYDRESFAWRTDVDRNGCDTRNDVLRRDLADVAIRGGTRGCAVQSGVLTDPYSGERIEFDRSRDPEAVQIDHVVSLSDAWSSGAWRWDADYRAAFANDPLELMAASAAENSDKSDATADEWLPEDPSDRCALVVRQVSIKVRTELSVTRAEHDAMARVLDDCGDLPLLSSDDVRWPAPAR
ncbi:HNH endonuclease [Clavibacter capsici]|uniref:HNH endonuclease family protein n=1 Tax=Clavibacter capsici TaxID=1874630 RepID=UPI00142848B8|nr:HNH endonuclease family protein [Clavibacter capsici]QIS42430.1 HNH endonuclease [Clavibacter capsici]